METGARKTLIGEAIGHAMHDTWFGIAPVLLAAVSSPLGLRNSDIGLMILVYQAVSSVTQPLFGRLSERYGGRLFAVGSIIWTTLMFTGALFAPDKLVMGACIGLAGLGSGAFHPQGSVNSTVAGGLRYGATAASIFFFGGTLGAAFLGSALGGLLIGRFGPQSLVVISALSIVTALTVVRPLVPKELAHPPEPELKAGRRVRPAGGAVWVLVALLLAAIALRALTQQTLTTYIPKYQQDLGVEPAVYGAVLSLFLAGNAVGGVVGAFLADRVGFREVLVGSLLMSGVALLLFMRLSGVAGYASLVLAGFLLGPSHTLLLVSGQRRFPQRMAMISGLFLGFTFTSGAVGAWVLGLIADGIGLGAVLSVLPIALLAGACCALVAVPGRSHARQPLGDPAIQAKR